eukprot:213647_1
MSEPLALDHQMLNDVDHLLLEYQSQYLSYLIKSLRLSSNPSESGKMDILNQIQHSEQIESLFNLLKSFEIPQNITRDITNDETPTFKTTNILLKYFAVSNIVHSLLTNAKHQHKIKQLCFKTKYHLHIISNHQKVTRIIKLFHHRIQTYNHLRDSIKTNFKLTIHCFHILYGFNSFTNNCHLSQDIMIYVVHLVKFVYKYTKNAFFDIQSQTLICDLFSVLKNTTQEHLLLICGCKLKKNQNFLQWSLKKLAKNKHIRLKEAFWSFIAFLYAMTDQNPFGKENILKFITAYNILNLNRINRAIVIDICFIITQRETDNYVTMEILCTSCIVPLLLKIYHQYKNDNDIILEQHIIGVFRKCIPFRCPAYMGQHFPIFASQHCFLKRLMDIGIIDMCINGLQQCLLQLNSEQTDSVQIVSSFSIEILKYCISEINQNPKKLNGFQAVIQSGLQSQLVQCYADTVLWILEKCNGLVVLKKSNLKFQEFGNDIQYILNFCSQYYTVNEIRKENPMQLMKLQKNIEIIQRRSVYKFNIDTVCGATPTFYKNIAENIICYTQQIDITLKSLTRKQNVNIDIIENLFLSLLERELFDQEVGLYLLSSPTFMSTLRDILKYISSSHFVMDEAIPIKINQNENTLCRAVIIIIKLMYKLCLHPYLNKIICSIDVTINFVNGFGNFLLVFQILRNYALWHNICIHFYIFLKTFKCLFFKHGTLLGVGNTFPPLPYLNGFKSLIYELYNQCIILSDNEMKRQWNDVIFVNKKCSNFKCKNIRKKNFGKQEKMLKYFGVCKGCTITRYCSLKCQKYHWKKGHKTQCKSLRNFNNIFFGI